MAQKPWDLEDLAAKSLGTSFPQIHVLNQFFRAALRSSTESNPVDLSVRSKARASGHGWAIIVAGPWQ